MRLLPKLLLAVTIITPVLSVPVPQAPNDVSSLEARARGPSVIGFCGPGHPQFGLGRFRRYLFRKPSYHHIVVHVSSSLSFSSSFRSLSRRLTSTSIRIRSILQYTPFGHRAFAGLGRTSNPLHKNYRAHLASLQLEPTARGFQVLQVLDADHHFKCSQTLSTAPPSFIHLQSRRVQLRRIRKSCSSRARDTLSEAAKATLSPPKQSQETGLRQRKPSSIRTHPSSTQGQTSEFSRTKSSTPGPIVVNDAIAELTAVEAQRDEREDKIQTQSAGPHERPP
ncbi:hypothetical protein NMY22_g4032 [Coprinellus aureogranulatus]|nr:hypothetical protein NMY22_g4032 [Coprinellus aureogranulatus]